MNEITTEDIAQHYSAMGDSVTLINAGQPEGMSAEDWSAALKRNKEHLVGMLAQDFWTTEDMTAVNAAIAI
jgi:hypothetical protein